MLYLKIAYFDTFCCSCCHGAPGLLHQAHRAGAFTAEINPGATGASGTVDLAIAAPAEDALPMLDVRMRLG
jgi:hypothetical protein